MRGCKANIRTIKVVDEIKEPQKRRKPPGDFALYALTHHFSGGFITEISGHKLLPRSQFQYPPVSSLFEKTSYDQRCHLFSPQNIASPTQYSRWTWQFADTMPQIMSRGQRVVEAGRARPPKSAKQSGGDRTEIGEQASSCKVQAVEPAVGLADLSMRASE